MAVVAASASLMTGAINFGDGDQIKERNVRTLTIQAATIVTVTPNLVRSISSTGAGVPTKGRNAATLTIPVAIILMPTPEPSPRTISLIGVGVLTPA